MGMDNSKPLLETPYIFLPKHKEEKRTGVLQILPNMTPDEVHIKCNKCGNINVMNKEEVYENKSFACWDCKKIYVIENIPSDIKSYLKKTDSYDINQRPRIVRQ